MLTNILLKLLTFKQFDTLLICGHVYSLFQYKYYRFDLLYLRYTEKQNIQYMYIYMQFKRPICIVETKFIVLLDFINPTLILTLMIFKKLTSGRRQKVCEDVIETDARTDLNVNRNCTYIHILILGIIITNNVNILYNSIVVNVDMCI